MNTIKHWILAGVVASGMLLVPLHNAHADGPYGDGYHGGYRGGYPAGRHGGYYGHHGYRGGYRGDCWNCGAAGAAIIGLAIGALVGSAIADATAPPVAVAPPGPPPAGGCAAVVVGGVSYYNCDDYGDDYGYGYNPQPNYYWNGYGVRDDGWRAK